MLEIKNLSKSYGSKKALDNISLNIPSGQIIGLFGENGAGKTTLIKSVFGFHRYSGEITLDGAPVTYRNIARLSFATCEHSFFPALTPKAHREFYEMHFPAFRKKRFQLLMDFFELEQNKPLRSFSAGRQNQFETVLALSQGADYILMDEPFSGNDIFNREDFYKVLLGILEPDETVMISTHLISEVEHFIDRAVLIHRGKLAADRQLQQLEEEGKTLLSFIKETYHYKQNRIETVLSECGENEK